MSTVVTDATATVAALDTDRTVSRDLVHRWSLSEVFLTGYAGVDADRFTCVAQLPLSHGYYRDHLAAGGVHDPLLVLEAGRQAMTYAVHAHQGLPRTTALMAASWQLAITDPTALACAVRPGELRIDGEVTDRRVRGGQVRRLVFEFGLVLDGRPLGRLGMAIGTTPTEQYLALRRMGRGDELIPTAFEVSAQPAGQPVHPSDVDRLDPRNVVLDDTRRDGDGLAAVLSPRTFTNRSMYDHPYDHVPGMVLTEAARQCALLLSERRHGRAFAGLARRRVRPVRRGGRAGRVGSRAAARTGARSWPVPDDRHPVRCQGGQDRRANGGVLRMFAFFDVDETLISVKSMFDFYDYFLVAAGHTEAERRELTARATALLGPGVPRLRANQLFYQRFADYKVAEVADIGQAWFADRLARGELFHVEVLAALRAHKAAGARIALVSGSFSACLQPVAEYCGADTVLCTELVQDDGRYTGEVVRSMIGDAKADAAAELISRERVLAADCAAYGDHGSDLGLLRLVGHPVAVGDNPDLLAVAIEQGWPRLSCATS